MTRPRRIAVIGGGAAGLSAAIRLRDRGYDDVTVFEGADQVGGKACSVEVDGRYYDVGAVVIGQQRYPHTWALARRYGMQIFSRKPLFAVDLNSAKWMALDDAIGSAHSPQEYFSAAVRVRHYIKRYRKYFDMPGFSFNHCPELGWLREELSLPFQQWIEKRRLTSLATMWEALTVDMGYGPYREVPAMYLLDYRLCNPRHGIRSLLRQKLCGHDGLRSFTLGAQALLIEMAKDCHVRMEVWVQRIARKNGVLYLYSGDERELGSFDAVLLATPLDNAFDLLDASGETATANKAITQTGERVRSEIRHTDYFATVAEADGLPDAAGYFSFGSQDLGLPGGHSASRPWPQSPLWVFYHYGSPDQPGCPDAALDQLRGDLRKVDVRLKTVVMSKSWPKYFPHVSPSAIATGFYDDIDSLQGMGDIYYLGGALGFETLEHTIAYSYWLVDRHFPVVGAGQAADRQRLAARA